jgi:hypothetical protein
MVLRLLSKIFGVQTLNLCMVSTIRNLYIHDDEFEDEGDATIGIDGTIGLLEEVINAFINEQIPEKIPLIIPQIMILILPLIL